MAALRFVVGIFILLAVKNVMCPPDAHNDFIDIQCGFADPIADLLYVFYEIFDFCLTSSITQKTELLETTFDVFNETQPSIEKVLYVLLSHLDSNPVLNPCDETLIKTTLAINLFILDNKRTSASEVNNDLLFDTINRLHNSTQRFRFKYCSSLNMYGDQYTVVRNAVRKDDLSTKNIKEILNDKTRDLDSAIESMILKYEQAYIEGMYNVNSLLRFGDTDDNIWQYENWAVTNAFKRITRDNSGLTSNQFLDKIKNSVVNIKDVFIAQNVLFKIISDLFVRRAVILLKNQPLNKVDLSNFLMKLNQFIDTFMPNGCLTTECDPVTLTRDTFNKIMRNISAGISRENLLEFIRQEELLLNNNLWGDTNPTDEFVTYILNEINKFNQTGPFSQVAKVLSHESNTNFIYSVKMERLWDDNGNAVNDDSYKNLYAINTSDQTVFDTTNEKYVSLDEFRKKLIALFACYTYYKTNQVPQEEKKLDITDVMFHFFEAYNKFNDSSHIQKTILLPFIFILSETQYKMNQETEELEIFEPSEDFFLVTANVVENYMFQAYKCKVSSNLTVYIENVLTNDGTLDIKTWETTLKKTEVDSKNRTKFFITFYNNDSLRVVLSEYYSSKTQMKFAWYGNTSMTAADIYKSWSSSLLDWPDLIQYRWFVIRWAVAELLVDTSLSLNNNSIDVNKVTSTENCIKNAFGINITNIQWMSVRQFITNVLNAFNNKIPDNTDVKAVIGDSLSSLGVNKESLDNVASIFQYDNACKRVTDDFSFLLKVLKTIKDENISIFNLETVSFTTVLLHVHPKAFNEYMKTNFLETDAQEDTS